ncbi:MAG: glycosyltransferase family 4 protein [Cyclobacteriaceae bacterium]|nr:glycosyltransferase family 4 protein [Cyclobacteriaceae bacterium]
MNILFLNSLRKGKWGGGEKWMVKAGEGLKARGHQVTIACLAQSVIEEKSRERGLGIFNFGIVADIAFWQMPRLKSYLKSHKIDVLVCCQNKDVKVGALAARQVGLSAIFARQGLQNLSDKKKYIRPFTRYIDGIITNTSSIKRIYESYQWIPEDFVHVIYNGVELPGTIRHIDLHQTYHLPAGSKTIFSAGRLDHQKGFDLLIHMAYRARQQNLDWQLIIAGEGKIKNELNSLAAKMGVGDMVHFIGFSNEVPALLKAADVFVLTSRYEGMPNALLEAMAMGKANVATRVNGAPELVEDGISGFLTDAENVDQLFDKTRELLENDTLRQSMGNHAAKRVQEHFTYEKMTGELECLFQKFVLK